MAAALSTELPTLLDMIKLQDPDGAPAKVVELLQRKMPMLEDMVFKEGNLTTGHRVTSRTGLPSIGWRRLNEGISASKSQTDQFDETCGLLEGLCVVDAETLRLNGNGPAYRASKSVAFVQSMTNEVGTGLIYHSTKASPEKFLGLSPRYDSIFSQSGNQIILADPNTSGSDNTSIWGVVWSPDSVYGIYPKGTVGGLEHEDLGKQLWDDGSGANKKFVAWLDHWMWRVGLVVEDHRQVVRVANIDVSNLTVNASAGADLVQSMIRAFYRINDPNSGRLVWYCNRTVATYLHLQALSAVRNSTLSIENIGGKPITMFLGAPVRTTDAITDSEAAIVSSQIN